MAEQSIRERLLELAEDAPDPRPMSAAMRDAVAVMDALAAALGACLVVAERPLKNAMNLKGMSPYDLGMEALAQYRGERG